MRLLSIASLLGGLICLTGSAAFAADKPLTVTPAVPSYPLCNINQLALDLSIDFKVKIIADKDAHYDYYLVQTADFNVDQVRKQTCQFIRQNQCSLYWGNVANMALIASKKAAWFPLDTSPHYSLSPVITCNKLK